MRILDILDEKQIAIDGKKLCGTAPRKQVLQIAKATNDRLSLGKSLVRASMDKDYLRILLKNFGF